MTLFLPIEIGHVLIIVVAELKQILGELLRAGEVMHVDQRVIARHPQVNCTHAIR